jgi:hypothetical protein
MAFPTNWPPRPSSGVRSIRVYIADTLAPGGAFSDNAYLFAEQTGANPFSPLPGVRPGEDVSAPDYGGPHEVPEVPAGAGVQPPGAPPAALWSSRILIANTGSNDLEFSFDDSDTNVHGVVPGGETIVYTNRYESGIALRSTAGTTFRVEAW